MNNYNLTDGVWLIYDGDCPLCQYAAHTAQIYKKHGSLHLLNARENNEDHLLFKMIQQRNLDLDEGMVIYHQGDFYHGKNALHFMSQFGTQKGILQRITYFLFRSKKIATMLYPFLRFIRNILLRFRSIGKIDSTQKIKDPILKSAFKEHWEQLPESLKKRYINRPYCNDKTTIRGVMSLNYHWIMGGIRPFYRFLGLIPIERVKNAPATVHFNSQEKTKILHFSRFFEFPNQSYSFSSQMMQQRDNHIIEIMKFGFCWKITCLFQQNKVILKHRGYAIKLFNFFLPLPLTFIIGKIDAEEFSIDENSFGMRLIIHNPIFGDIYTYSGTFTFTELPQ